MFEFIVVFCAVGVVLGLIEFCVHSIRKWRTPLSAEKTEEERNKEERMARKSAAQARQPLGFYSFKEDNKPLIELVYSQTDGSEEQRQTLEKIIGKYIEFNKGRNVTPDVIAEVLHVIKVRAHEIGLKHLEKLTVEKMHELLVKK